MAAFTKSDSFQSEYSCAIVRIGEMIPISGSDFLAKTEVFGTQIVVRKDKVKTGDLMLYASNETQLNKDFLSVNNAFEIGCRDMNANADEVNEIMKPYMVLKEQADKYKAQAKKLKSKMDGLSKMIIKKKKEIDRYLKKRKESTPDDESELELYIKETNEHKNELVHKCDEMEEQIVALTTQYVQAKNKAEQIVADGKDIVDEAKKKVGYFNKYGRVRTITLQNTPSFGCLFGIPELFKFDKTITTADIEAYEGQEFDTVNGVLFVKVYVPPMPERKQHGKGTGKAQKKLKRFDRLVEGEFAFHYDTQQFQKNVHQFNPEDVVTISVKLHGTSVIIGKLPVKNPIKLPFFQRAWNWFVDGTGLFRKHRITDYEIGIGPIYSSRKVIKNQYINKDVNSGYYSVDVWSEYGDIIYPYLDEGMTIYGEILGYETGNDKPIQKLYDYGCEQGENRIMIYRITSPDENGLKREWEVDEVFDWTLNLIDKMEKAEDENYKKIHPINILYHGKLEDMYPEVLPEGDKWHEKLLEMMKNDTKLLGMEEIEPMCTKHIVPREGVCIRKDHDPIRECFKLKSMAFAIGEAVRMDNGEVDIELDEGYSEESDDEA